MSGEKLLPCPFCGGEAKLYDDYSSERDERRWQVWHVCDNGPEGESAGYGLACHTSIDMPWFKSREKAIEAWNTRAAVTDHDFAMAVHDGDLWGKCSECKERQGHYLDAETIRNQQERIAELERERDEWQLKCCEEAGLHASHVFQRDELIRDMWAGIVHEHSQGGFPDMGLMEKRMRELGIEVG